MLYHGNLVLLILLLKSQVTEGSGYNCSDFKSQQSKYTLVECPPAKFMLKDNLVECFDNFTKQSQGITSKDPLSFFSVTKYSILHDFSFLYWS